MGACLSSSGGTKSDAAPKRLAVAEQPKSILNKQEGTTTSKLNKTARCREVYHIGKTLGTGGFSVVKLAKEKATGREYACKVMALPPIGANTRDHDSTREDIFKEIEVLVGLAHDNVVYLQEYFEEGDKVFLILELLMGGELLDAVLAKGSYLEADARLCFVQLLRGIHYLHSRGVCHRDLKLENLLLATSGDIGRIKIADFGLAKKAAKDDFLLDTVCGTPQYVAPEVIAGDVGLAYTPAVDLWAAGVVLYVLLGGYPPFYDESEPELFKLIRKGEYRFDDPVWDTVSDSAKDLLGHLLVVDPEQRYSAAQALSHPWLHSPIEDHALDLTRLNMRRNLAAKRRFKAAVRAVIAQQRLAHLVEQVQRGDVAPKSAILLNSEEDMKAATEAARRYELQQIQKELQCTEETSVHQFQGRSSSVPSLAI